MANKIFKKDCPICGKLIESLSESQFNYNFNLHYESCKKRIRKEVKNDKNKS